MKKLFLGILIIMCFAVTGCSSSKGKLLINCNSEESKVEVKNNAKFTCRLAGQEYELKITKIENKKITIIADKKGLSKVTEEGTIGLLDTQTEFTIEEDKELDLAPQVTDNFELLIINWKK